MRTCIAFLIFLFPFLILNGQVSFSSTSGIFQDSANFSGVCIGVADMNGDGLDDIIRLDSAIYLSVEYQNSGGSFGNHYIGKVSIAPQWSLCVADVDQNGFNDILVGGTFDSLKLFKANVDGTSYARSELPYSDTLFIQGTNFMDINGDGWVDVFAGNDDGDNSKYENDGTGNFAVNNALINTQTIPVSDNSGNYGSVWTDYDNDGDHDLYISKCRSGVTDPTDPRRINMLLQNDGNNNFTEVAASAGLASGDQSWSADFGDIDNDGDLDAFVINHYTLSTLFENNGDGTFTDITSSSGLAPHLNFYGIQVLFRDFDNDGFVDLFLTGKEDRIFFNNGDRTFTTATDPFPGGHIESAAIGDLNHDGFLDIYAGYAEFFTTPSETPDTLFLNNGNEHHFFAITLKGIHSNINAIGARIELYGAWGKQIREVRGGESYGIMNTFTQHFGLGNETQIDSVVIRWPRKLNGNFVTDKIILPAIDQFMVVEEGMTTGIAGLNEEAVNIFPNPVRGQVAIEIAAPFQGKLQMEVYDLAGRKILQTSEKLFQGGIPFSLDISGIHSGIYLLRLINDEGLPVYQTKIEKD